MTKQQQRELKKKIQDLLIAVHKVEALIEYSEHCTCDEDFASHLEDRLLTLDDDLQSLRKFHSTVNRT